MDEVIDPMLAAEQCLEAAVRVQHEHDGRMVDRVIAVLRRVGPGEVNAERAGQLLDFGDVAGYPDDVVAESARVARQRVGRRRGGVSLHTKLGGGQQIAARRGQQR